MSEASKSIDMMRIESFNDESMARLEPFISHLSIKNQLLLFFAALQVNPNDVKDLTDIDINKIRKEHKDLPYQIKDMLLIHSGEEDKKIFIFKKDRGYTVSLILEILMKAHEKAEKKYDGYERFSEYILGKAD